MQVVKTGTRKRPATRIALQPKGYAKRLSPYSEKGLCGDEVPEAEEGVDELLEKVELLAEAIRRASYVVAHTGAGMSTAAGIPDFRGKNGIWTKEKNGEPLPDYERCWNNAVPTLGHMALVGLMRAKLLQYIVSQNIDGLHLRSGIPRKKLSELHGNMFMERCDSCGFEVVRSRDVGGIGGKPTGRRCPKRGCGSRMVDSLLDWEDDLPEPDFSRAVAEADKCSARWGGGDEGGGLALCLGTSMQMLPARELPCQAGRMVIVNLQETIKDEEAWLVIRGRIDDVMHAVMTKLNIPIPVYERVETFTISHQVSVRHCISRGPERLCSITSHVRLSVAESATSQGTLSGFLGSVTLAFSDKSVPLEAQPFVHDEQVCISTPADQCPVCTRASSAHMLAVIVTVHFEEIPPVTAGRNVLPAVTPPPCMREYRMAVDRTGTGSQDVTVKLVTVDYNELWGRDVDGGSGKELSLPHASSSNERKTGVEVNVQAGEGANVQSEAAEPVVVRHDDW